MFAGLQRLKSSFTRHSLHQPLIRYPHRPRFNSTSHFVSISSLFRSMFSRAVEDYQSTRPAPKAASPSSKVTTQASLQTVFSRKPAPKLASVQNHRIFQQSALSGNGIPPYRPVVAPVPALKGDASILRKRSFDQREHNIADAFDDASSFQENALPQIEPFPSGSIGGTNVGVYFNEADFEDDDDLDFDISMPMINATLAKAAASIPSPKLSAAKPQPPDRSKDKVPMPPKFHSEVTSSAPIPWSSSPVENFQSMTASRKLVKQEPQAAQEEPKPKKRRTLPWKSAEEVKNEAPKHSVNSKATSQATRSNSSSLPWDATAADILAGKRDTKKRALKQQSRSMSTTAGDPESQAKAKKSRQRPAAVFLSDEQKHVVAVAEAGKSVFFTGAAGTGKSVLLRELIAALKRKHKKDTDSVAVTASTGLAACNIGGVTLHSFSGIGLGKEPVPDLVKKIKRNGKAKSRWLRTKILIIDEISMVDGDLFDKLEAIARQIKNNGRAFGGIQLVITGDFFQLPPVPEGGRLAKFAFDANTWNTCVAHTIRLTQVFRQRDPEFADMLNEMRLGRLSTDTIQTFQRLGRSLIYNDGIEATELFPTRQEVDRANNLRMRQLGGQSMVFSAEDKGTQEKQFRDKLLQACMAPVSIELKLHAQVMLIKNIDETLVNGSLGRVVGFMNEKTFDTLADRDDFEAALGDNEEDLSAQQKRVRDLARAPGIDTARRWPLVQFAMPDGTSRQLLVQPESWKVELPNGEVQAARNQIPLILAWALSIHKAQGQTLERVKVDLGRVFEKGQAYVALSRATCKEGLQVLRFAPGKVMAHDKVRSFYENLGDAQEAARKLKEEQNASKKIARILMPKQQPLFEENEELMMASGQF